ncbi:MAG: zf-HC2 domain-containing protein [Opitutae bacterium]|nr:zf-HC2 domain-containing protein [Opitutae bacterium]
MNCRDIEPLLLAERDGVLTKEQHAALADHAATCPACRQLRAELTAAVEDFRSDAAKATLPNIDEEWRTLRAQLHSAETKPTKKRPLAPVIWFGASLAAAAAVAFAFIVGKPTSQPAPLVAQTTVTASADFVEAADTNASTMVYVDKDSGWLVVWATDTAAPAGG